MLRTAFQKWWWLLLLVLLDGLLLWYFFRGSTVSGTVTVDGMPVPRGRIMMVHASSSPGARFAPTQDDLKTSAIIEKGKYKITGLDPGEYQVWVVTPAFRNPREQPHRNFTVSGSSAELDVALDTPPQPKVRDKGVRRKR